MMTPRLLSGEFDWCNLKHVLLTHSYSLIEVENRLALLDLEDFENFPTALLAYFKTRNAFKPGPHSPLDFANPME